MNKLLSLAWINAYNLLSINELSRTNFKLWSKPHYSSVTTGVVNLCEVVSSLELIYIDKLGLNIIICHIFSLINLINNHARSAMWHFEYNISCASKELGDFFIFFLRSHSTVT